MWVLRIFFFILLAQYIIGPILIYFIQKFPIKYNLTKSSDEVFLNKQNIQFQQMHQQIQTNNFIYVGSSLLKISTTNTYFSIYRNDSIPCTCTLSTVSTQGKFSTQIEFTQMYEDGSVTNVNNNPLIDVFPKTSKKISFRFAKMNDFNKLLDSAEKLFNLVNKAKLTKNLEGNEFGAIETFLNEELQFLIQRGWLSSKERNNQYHLTLKGAVLLTWQLCFPVKQFLSYKDSKYSREWLNSV